MNDITLNKSEWLEQHRLLYAAHTWPEGALISVNAQKSDTDAFGTVVKRFYSAGFVSVTDPDAVWAILEREANAGHDSWISLGGLKAEAGQTRGRGSKADVIGLPALFADIDFAGADHKIDGNPTPKEAIGWVDRFTVEIGNPTIVNHSGGGAHVLVALDEVLQQDNPEHVELTLRWKAWWMALAAETNQNIDKSPLADFARIYRAAGAWNQKQGRQVRTTRINDDARYSVAELLEILPPVPVKTRSTTRTKSLSTRTDAADATEALTDDSPIGTRFAYEVPISHLLTEVYEADIDSSDLVTFPRPDGSYAAEHNAKIFAATDESPEQLTVYGQRVLDEFEIDEEHSLNSFRFLGKVILKGNFALAKKLVAATKTEDGWDDELFRRIDDFRNGQPLDVTSRGSELVIVPEAPMAASADDEPARAEYDGLAGLAELKENLGKPVAVIRDAIEKRRATVVELTQGLTVFLNCVDGDEVKHGLYMKRKVEDEKGVTSWVDVQITDWIAWRSQVVSQSIVDGAAKRVEVDTSYRVEIVTASGMHRSRDGFTKEQSTKVALVVDSIDAGVALPVDSKDRARIETMLRTFGYDERDDIESYGTCGWLLDEDTHKHVLLAPAGSVSAKGVDPSFTVTAPPHSQEGALGAAAAGIGYVEVPADTGALRKAAESIPALFRIVPDRADLAAASIGMVFAAPLALTSRGSIFLVAPPESAKSKFAGCVQAFVSQVSNGKSFTGGPILKNSAFATGVLASWGRHTTMFWDDFKFDGGSIQLATQNVGTAVNAAYGSDAGASGTRDRGLGTTLQASPACFLTGEGTPEGDGFLSRMIRIEIGMDDVARTPAGESPLDEFLREFAPLANQVHGAYIQWLARRLDETGMAQFTRENDAAKQAWMSTHPTSRTAENVGTLGVGWERLYAFAEEKGFLDVLPAKATVAKALKELLDDNVKTLKGDNSAVRIINAVRDRIASGKGYVDTPDGKTPFPSLARALGWERRTSLSGEVEWVAGRVRLGVLSNDGTTVAITNDAIRAVQAEIGMRDVPGDQLTRAAGSLVVTGTKPGARPGAGKFTTRPRGWIVTVEQLDLDVPANAIAADIAAVTPTIDEDGGFD